jgi:hypothetical protein
VASRCRPQVETPVQQKQNKTKQTQRSLSHTMPVPISLALGSKMIPPVPFSCFLFANFFFFHKRKLTQRGLVTWLHDQNFLFEPRLRFEPFRKIVFSVLLVSDFPLWISDCHNLPTLPKQAFKILCFPSLLKQAEKVTAL